MHYFVHAAPLHTEDYASCLCDEVETATVALSDPGSLLVSFRPGTSRQAVERVAKCLRTVLGSDATVQVAEKRENRS